MVTPVNNRKDKHPILSFPECYSLRISFATLLKHTEAITEADTASKLAARCLLQSSGVKIQNAFPESVA